MSSDHLDAFFEGQPARLTASQASELLGVSDRTVYVWLRDGVIPGYRIGVTWFILREDLRDVMRAGRNAAVASLDEDSDPKL